MVHLTTLREIRLRGLKKALENCDKITDKFLKGKAKAEIRKLIEELENDNI